MIRDSPFIVEEKGKVEINYGKRFPMRKNLMTYGAIAFIIIIMLLPSDSGAYKIAVPFCLFIVLIMLTATTGVKLDTNKNKFQYYFSVFGISVGKWKKWSGFSCLVLKSSIKKRDRSLTRDFIDLETVTERFKTTEIYIMDSSHRKKILCGSFDSYKEAKVFAKEVSEVLNYPIQKFSPRRIIPQRRR
jgi:hypothetical protein